MLPKPGPDLQQSASVVQPTQQLRTTLGVSGVAHSYVEQKITSVSDLQALAGACDMFTGAELAGLCREAAITALREDLQV